LLIPLWHFANDRTLSKTDVDALVAWADSGAPEGDPKDRPTPMQWTEGWNIPEPDLVVEMPLEIQVPAKGTVEYTYMIVPTGFTEDKWVRQIETRPGNRAVVHHANVYVRRPGSMWLRQYPVGVAFLPEEQSISSAAGASWSMRTSAGSRRENRPWSSTASRPS
jgi:hypothetical protein